MKQSLLYNNKTDASFLHRRFIGWKSIIPCLVVLFVSPSLLAQASFSAKTDFAVSGNTWSVATGDLNGDGTPDMAATNYLLNTVSVLLNTTPQNGLAPSFSTKTDFTTGTNPVSVRIGDLNGDGKPDLAVANNISNSVSVLLNTTPAGASTPSFSAKTDFATSIYSYSLAIGDLNGDGKPDLVVGSFNTNTVVVLLNTTEPGAGTPSFAATTSFAASGISRSVCLSDINGDGKLDIVAADFNNPGTVSVLLNTTPAGASTPSFSAKTDFAVGSFPNAVSAGDLNGDGRPDLAVTSYTTATVSILLNTTTAGGSVPFFSAKTDFATGSNPNFVAMDNVDGDKIPDLAVANFGSSKVSVWLNTTTAGASVPSFSAKNDFTTGGNPSSLSFSDLNGDGNPDLAISNYGSSSISVLLNTTVPPPPAITFQNAYGGRGDEVIGNLIVTSDGGYVVAGSSKSCLLNDADVCLFKIDKSGLVQWAKTFGNMGNEIASVVATENGYMIAGSTQVSGNGSDILVVRTDAQGNVLWEKTYGGSREDIGAAVYRMKNGEYIVVGSTQTYGAGGWEGFAMRFDGNGNVLWFKTYGTGTTDLLNRLVEESDGSLVMTGTTYVTGTHNTTLLKTDAQGNLLWTKEYLLSSGDESGYGLARASNGDYLIVTGAYSSSSTDNILLYRTDSNGNLRWAKSYNSTVSGSTYDAGFDVKILTDGSIVIAGEWGGTTQEYKSNCVLLKTDSTGAVQWCRNYGGTETEYTRTVALTADGGFVLGGQSNSTVHGDYDFYVLKTDAKGLVDANTMSVLPQVTDASISMNTPAFLMNTYSVNAVSGTFTREGSACFGGNSSPIANAGPDQILEATSPLGAQVALNGSASSDPDGDVLIYTWREDTSALGTGVQLAVTEPLGVHSITLTADDSKGGLSSDTVVVRIVDTTPPKITLNGSDTVKVECGSSYVEPGASVVDIADPAPSLSVSGTVDTSIVGEYTIKYTAADHGGNTSTVSRIVKVVDTTPPTIVVSGTPTLLWPPNHKYVTVNISKIIVSVSDKGTPSIPINNVSIKSVSSDEPENAAGDGDGNTVNDMVIGSDAKSVDLRVERQGNGNGRVYTVILAVADASGNIGQADYEVWVPVNQSDKSAINDGAAYTVQASSSILPGKKGLSLVDSELPSEFALFTNYPNPFNPSTDIRFALPTDEFVSLKVYDMLGREVATLVEDHLAAGIYSMHFDASGNSSGVYIYRLKAGNTVQTKRMILMK